MPSSRWVYETTLSSNQPLDLMRRARLAEFSIDLVFVVLASIDLNVQRVAQRVARGGHDIPEKIVRRRHGRAITNLGRAIPLADKVVILDNTGDRPKVLLRMHGRMVEADDLDLREPMHARISEVVSSVIGRNENCWRA